ncbi:MAG: D-aminoacylase [bacterium]|nr:D-aminoacylase [bacterium]
MPADLVIANARVVDGGGNPWYRADVGVTQGRIAWILPPGSGAPAGRAVEAGGRVLAPGFIDIHGHSDLSLFSFPLAPSKLLQGVTTEVGGNCGWSAGPLTPEMERQVRAEHPRPEDLPPGFRTLGDHLASLEALGLAVNYGCHVGHGMLREAVMGSQDRAATGDELAAMAKLLEAALDDGALGLSSGLIYAPGCYAPPEELTALARVAYRRGRLYASHIRGEGPTLEQSVAEAINVGRQGSGPVQIAHHKASGRRHWGKVARSLALVDEVRDQGVDVTLDQYPYVASQTDLTAYLPAWAREGGTPALLDRLRDPAVRSRLLAELTHLRGEAEELADWSLVVLAYVRGHREWEGRAVADIAGERGRPAPEVVLDLVLEEEGAVGVIHFGMDEADVRRVMAHPAVMVGSDGSALGPDPIWGKPHPRSYGTFARVLGRYVREERVLRLEEAVRKMTGMPAARLGLTDRGRVAPGCWADLVLLDPETIADTATFEDPCRHPTGIDLVLVNGVVAAEDGRPTGARPGKVLRAG